MQLSQMIKQSYLNKEAMFPGISVSQILKHILGSPVAKSTAIGSIGGAGLAGLSGGDTSDVLLGSILGAGAGRLGGAGINKLKDMRAISKTKPATSVPGVPLNKLAPVNKERLAENISQIQGAGPAQLQHIVANLPVG